MASTLVRQCKNEIQRSELKAEEQYHFHRITSGQLSEAISDQFRKCKDMQSSEKAEPKSEEKQVPKVNQDDVFIDEHDDYGFEQD